MAVGSSNMTVTEAPIPHPTSSPAPPESQAPPQQLPNQPVRLPPPPVGPLPLDPGSVDPTAGSSAAAIARSAASSMAFIFKRPPLRFFRPVKISTYGALQVMAEERGRPVSLKFVQSVIKKEGPWKFILNHTLPPFFFNTLIGLTLFTTYTSIENQLSKSQPHLHPYLVPALAGSVAGAAQSLISAPLDNLRLLQVSQANSGLGSSSSSSTKIQFKGWIPLLKQVMLPLSLSTHPGSNSTGSERFKLWASRGWGMLGLSVIKDSLGFATFFSIFQIGRDLGKRLANSVDRSIHIVWTGSEDHDEFVGARGWTGRILQSCVIVLSGATAGWAYGIVAEPFEALRRALWQARLDWASIHLNDTPANKTKVADKSSSYASRHPPHHPHPRHQHSSFTNFNRVRSSHCWRSKKSKLGHQFALPSFLSKAQRTPDTRKPMIGSQKPPSIFKILKHNLQNRRKGLDIFGELISSIKRPKIRVTDSNSTNAMKLDASGNLFHFFRARAHKKPLSIKTATRVTGFRSFILSPYSIGFFVWAVCSGDLTV
ncbi:hypothetical protein PtA15_8A213 [Puccinia triticina]|uniref:Mitochondrial carrier n=1 Tax=Puccinia triticina TaxID=208348 RepID=A0ABY7CRM3_9BASI|nr:uncharacterized protein PtA15_8A213 [Puccinia triticina]WAQ87309.1 hypothetical protein PtA15_8A213 [Puccinia triticina]WAR57163.1 hypothetical protein PtB15_8B210 [Puccinia triticina]